MQITKKFDKKATSSSGMTSRVYVCTGNHFGRFVDWAIGEVVLGVPKAGREGLIFFLGLLRKH